MQHVTPATSLGNRDRMLRPAFVSAAVSPAEACNRTLRF
ncbi:hypothetical protein HD593_008309 [Nonomuraea rubra]|uniref:Uncharacterized protein n=1 Tax=Nonomuraea rubra TaxID=46180 RepID=A0A7X0U3H8_9ACTN|nr:hypothetical protein [Nonomuraea rubra]